MWIIQSLFLSDNGIYTKSEENAIDKTYALMKYHRELERWYQIIIESRDEDDSAMDELRYILNYYDEKDKNEYDDVMLYIIKDDLKRKNKKNNTNCSFEINMIELIVL